MKMKTRVCELCSGEASLYCVSDSAFLCWSCDLRVHQANFLVARHVRLTVCSKCNEFDGNRRSGTGFKSFIPICISCCSSENKDQNRKSVSNSSSLSSDCISTTGESCKSVEDQPKAIKFYDFFDLQEPKKKIDCSSEDTDSCFPMNFSGKYSSENQKKKPETKTRSRKATDHDHQLHRVKAEGILVNWGRKLGLKVNGEDEGGAITSVLPVALQAFGVCLERITVLPFRVALASSIWFSLKGRRGSLSATCQNRVIRKVEEISGVPAKLIILGESKISRILNLNRRSKDGENQEEEGWAECTE